MDKEYYRDKIKLLEDEIKRSDEKIKKLNREIEAYNKNARDCREVAARGGDLVHTAKEMMRGAEEWENKADGVRGKISNIEREQAKKRSEIDECRRMLDDIVADEEYRASVEREKRARDERNDQPIYAKPQSSAPRIRTGGSRYSKSGSNARKIDNEVLTEVIKLVVIYTLAVVAVSFAASKLFFGFIVGLAAMIVGPVIFTVLVLKKFSGSLEDKKTGKTIIVFGMGLVVTLVAMSELSIGSIIFAAIVCFGAALLLERIIDSN